MTEAPDRVWRWNGIAGHPPQFNDTAGTGSGVEYIRKDASDAAVKVAAKDGYTAGRQDAQVLCNLWFAGTNTSAPDLLGKDQDNE